MPAENTDRSKCKLACEWKTVSDLFSEFYRMLDKILKLYHYLAIFYRSVIQYILSPFFPGMFPLAVVCGLGFQIVLCVAICFQASL